MKTDFVPVNTNSRACSAHFEGGNRQGIVYWTIFQFKTTTPLKQKTLAVRMAYPEKKTFEEKIQHEQTCCRHWRGWKKPYTQCVHGSLQCRLSWLPLMLEWRSLRKKVLCWGNLEVFHMKLWKSEWQLDTIPHLPAIFQSIPGVVFVS